MSKKDDLLSNELSSLRAPFKKATEMMNKGGLGKTKKNKIGDVSGTDTDKMMSKIAAVGDLRSGNETDMPLVGWSTDNIPHKEAMKVEARRLLTSVGSPYGNIKDNPEETARYLIDRVVNKKMIEQDMLLVDSIDWNSPAELAHCYKMIPDVKGLIDRQIAFAKCIAQVQLAMAEVALKGAFFDNNTWEFYKSMKLTNWNGAAILDKNGTGPDETYNGLPAILSRPVHSLQARDLLNLREMSSQMLALSPGMSVFDSLFTAYTSAKMVKATDRFAVGVTEYFRPALRYDASQKSQLFGNRGPANGVLAVRGEKTGSFLSRLTNADKTFFTPGDFAVGNPEAFRQNRRIFGKVETPTIQNVINGPPAGT